MEHARRPPARPPRGAPDAAWRRVHRGDGRRAAGAGALHPRRRPLARPGRRHRSCRGPERRKRPSGATGPDGGGAPARTTGRYPCGPHAPGRPPAPAALGAGADPGDRRSDRARRRPRGGARPQHRRPRPALGSPPARRRRPDRHRRRPAVRRPQPVHARRRGRAVPGLGDAAVRAGQPQRGDDGPPPRSALAAADHRAHPGDRRRRRPRPAAAPRSRGDHDRADPRAPGATCSTPRTSCAAWSSSATDASSSSSTAARWRCAARSSTSTPPPPTPRSASTCGATRSTD